ncbi:MAG: glycosyltransferase WbuB [Candidatus Aenigmarchaeota archaeon ex4484_56]|nr:MAG: glycosyltransferase WbuB [Candidatus Aenigmarchaeota archaeon ex4484_56]
MSKTDILIFVAHFPPEIGSASHLFFDLAKELQKKYNVKVITSFPRPYNVNTDISRYKGKFFMKERIEGIEVIRTKQPPIPKDNLFLRGLEMFILPVILFFTGLFVFRPKVILVYSPPLPLAAFSIILGRLKNIPVVVNIQDIYPQTVIDVGLLKNKFLITMFKKIERFVYKNADIITVHSEGNKNFIVKSGANKNKVKVIYNCSDIDYIKPMSRNNEFSRKYKLNKKFVVSYAGILSYHQGLDTIIEAAKLLETYEDIHFLIAGDGFYKEKLVKKIKNLNLKNITLLPFQPKEKYKLLLASSDISLVTLREDIKTPVVPGKLHNIMAAGRAVIACVPKISDAVNIIKKADCGICIEPNNPKKLADAILNLHKDKQKLKKFGRNGRMFAEKNFSLKTFVGEYEKIFRKL